MSLTATSIATVWTDFSLDQDKKHRGSPLGREAEAHM